MKTRHVIITIIASLTSLTAQDKTRVVRINNDEVVVHRGGQLWIPVLNNDYDGTGKIDRKSVSVEQAPQHGTATAAENGSVFYTNTGGDTGEDFFTYQVKALSGGSETARVRVRFSNDMRLANSALNVPAIPPSMAYQLVDALPGVVFEGPTGLESPPGDTNRLFVLEKNGVMKLIPDVAATKAVSNVYLDLRKLLESRGEKLSVDNEQGLIGLAFHPRFATNQWFYLFYSVIKPDGKIYERISRFNGSADSADPTSELVLIEQRDRAPNHQGSCLRFGLDGYLYISFGDEGGQNDQFDNSQRISKDFFSAIIRIDVDKKSGSLAPNPHVSIPTDSGNARYAVPPDNPFVHQSLGGSWTGSYNGITINDLTTVRTEFWATGFRNPWQMAFDPATGELWEGDVGGSRAEEVNIITRGGNYGWSTREGFEGGPKKPRPGEAGFSFIDPVFAYPHGFGTGQGNSITGGLVYHGTRLPALANTYIFSDYESGNVWSLRRNPTGAPTVIRICGESGITSFGTDPSNGDLLATHFTGHRLLRLVAGKPGSGFPQKLSATRLFSSTADLAPSPGVLPYAVNHAAWNDGAASRHWFTIPDGKSKIGWSRDGPWSLPGGTIWIQQLDAGSRRIETRLLVKNDAGAYGVSYRWDEDQKDATLVPEAGEDLTIDAPPQRWHVPGQSECMICHTPHSGYALSFNTRQLNTASVHPAFAGNQIDLLAKHGFFTGKTEPADTLPKFVGRDSESAALDDRARSYLGVNCANCHQPGGLAPTTWDLRPEIPLAATGLLTAASINNGGHSANQPLAPGDPAHSLILQRMSATNGFQRMPLLGTKTTDQSAIDLLTRWIKDLAPRK